MLAIKKARKLIEDKPNDEAAPVLAEFVQALENDQAFVLGRLYDLDYKRFELALEIMAEWRLDRHFSSKAKARLVQASQEWMTAAESAEAAEFADTSSE
jgi:hypothetical protein